MVPKLRFKHFTASLSEQKVGNILERFSAPVSVSESDMYREVGIRSHGRGLFHKDEISGAELGNKRVFWIKKNALILNIVFAWEQAVALTSSSEEGFIASHRFPMYFPKDNKCNTDFIRRYFLTKKGKSLLELASPGGAGRNKTLGQKNFSDLVLMIPDVLEQTKIADFLSSVDEKITLMNKQYDLLCQYKKGMMQKIFSQEIRFMDENGEEYPDWELKLISDIAIVNPKSKTLPTEFIYIDLESVEKGILKKKNLIYKDNAPSRAQRLLQLGDVLFQLVRPCSKFLYQLLHLESFISEVMNRCTGTSYPAINSSDLASIEVGVPCELEQTKIANFLSAIDDKITIKKTELDKLKIWKQGLLQQMFV